jgi:TRAP-type C4-dicarboxylate transport system permease small subunit
VRRFNGHLESLLYWGTATSSMLFLGVVLVGVVSRFVLHRPVLASIELSRLFFVWSVFLATALAYRRNAHVSIALGFERLPPRLQRVVLPATRLLMLAFCVAVAWQGTLLCLLLWQTRLPMLQISYSWLCLPLPLASLALASFLVETLVGAPLPTAGARTP